MAARPKVVCITQARTTSTRLPRKVLLEVSGRPLLRHHLDRLQACRRVDQVVLATTVNATDDPVVEIGRQAGVLVARGSEDDVLSRFVLAAELSAADVVVRVTSDCPLIDPGLIDLAVEALLEDDAVDYAHLDMAQFPRGLDVEVVRRRLLDQADGDPATTAAEREHVTPYIYNRPQRYRLKSVPSSFEPASGRWCVDEPRDFELVRRMLEALLPDKPHFTWRDCVALMAQHPDWARLNQQVIQKELKQ
ncbi:cytidylyltransferase domain-containing protein [Herbaspirillum sp. YR522]|uniref:cytidylyltransferase domain-containing protein n=1 Tax=Herbaspirillum sp. YR522 TaxID=1144342 RepID=UPI00026FAA9C|nr:glycosyltransferase family protein [Herbaspirillum sp. YR522]EJN09804.1 spore coat polysaccharide biosynthesis protein F, CMP-KDO synthetase [Herbaspirillum sp. YR522]